MFMPWEEDTRAGSVGAPSSAAAEADTIREERTLFIVTRRKLSERAADDPAAR
jgi:hypothetical protein